MGCYAPHCRRFVQYFCEKQLEKNCSSLLQVRAILKSKRYIRQPLARIVCATLSNEIAHVVEGHVVKVVVTTSLYANQLLTRDWLSETTCIYMMSTALDISRRSGHDMESSSILIRAVSVTFQKNVTKWKCR